MMHSEGRKEMLLRKVAMLENLLGFKYKASNMAKARRWRISELIAYVVELKRQATAKGLLGVKKVEKETRIVFTKSQLGRWIEKMQENRTECMILSIRKVADNDDYTQFTAEAVIDPK